MGIVGLSLGAVLTAVFIVYVKYFSQYQLPEIYYDRSIPIDLRPLSFVLIFGGAICPDQVCTLDVTDWMQQSMITYVFYVQQKKKIRSLH